jgi:hypothetical protein
MWVSQGNVQRVGAHGVGQFAPIGGDHVGGGAQAGGAPELGHHLAGGVAALGAAGVFGVREHAVQVSAQCDRVAQRPAAVGVKRDAGVREVRGERGDGFHL